MRKYRKSWVFSWPLYFHFYIDCGAEGGAALAWCRPQPRHLYWQKKYFQSNDCNQCKYQWKITSGVNAVKSVFILSFTCPLNCPHDLLAAWNIQSESNGHSLPVQFLECIMEIGCCAILCTNLCFVCWWRKSDCTMVPAVDSCAPWPPGHDSPQIQIELLDEGWGQATSWGGIWTMICKTFSRV